MTNGNRIRYMSDEKLAHVIRCPYIRQEKGRSCIKKRDGCLTCKLEWLQKEEQKNENHIRTDQKESRKDVSE